jgi:hypothetical protein
MSSSSIEGGEVLGWRPPRVEVLILLDGSPTVKVMSNRARRTPEEFSERVGARGP